jgi:hypothetical protein
MNRIESNRIESNRINRTFQPRNIVVLGNCSNKADYLELLDFTKIILSTSCDVIRSKVNVGEKSVGRQTCAQPAGAKGLIAAHSNVRTCGCTSTSSCTRPYVLLLE